MRSARTAVAIAGLLGVVAAAPTRAQLPPPPTLAPGTGLIVGQVVDAATGKGVTGALVTLANARRALTTNDGRFVFFDLPEGRHGLTAAKSGYIDGAFGMRRPGGASLPIVLSDGERRSDIVIRMWRHASISGVVVDEAGEPLTNITVTAFRRMTAAGRRRFAPSGTSTTDDRGMYRLSRLTPGDYVVAMVAVQVSVPASSQRQMEEAMFSGNIEASRALMSSMSQLGGFGGVVSGPTSRQVGDQVQTLSMNAPTPPPVDGTRIFAYPTTFFPAAASSSTATIVTVASAQERTGIDLHVKAVPTARVSGIVAGSGSLASMPLKLIPLGGEDAGRPNDVAGTITDANGAFTFLAVPAGEYTLRIVQVPRSLAPSGPTSTIQIGAGMSISTANPSNVPPPVPQEPTLWASVPVSVGDSDVTGLTIPLRTGVRVSGRVEFDGAAEKPAPDQLSRILVVVEPVDGLIDRISAPPGRVDAKGEFTTYGVAGGKYFVRVPNPPNGWTFNGAMLGERDLSDTPIDLDAADVADVVLSFTDHPSSLSGSVQMTDAAAREGVAVVVFPADSKTWIDVGATPRRLRRVAATDAGAYDVLALPPGAYYVAAIRESASTDWTDPKFLESLAAAATHVQIDAGEKATQNLKVLEVR
jgi:uncharacterized protein (DUF2141 family)